MLSSKKKIRGWKRHVRKIENWKQDILNLDTRALNKYQRDYAKIWIHPFYSIIKRNPPGWYNALVLDSMIEVYRNWHKTMSETEEDYYLKLWLFDPNFIFSQIVVAFKDQRHFYDNTFNFPTEQRDFPFHKYPRYLREKLEFFDWELRINAFDYEENSDSNTEDVWIGTLRKKLIK